MQKVVYTIIDDTAKKTLKDKVEFDHGLSGSKLSKKRADLDTIIKVYTNKGYEVVSQDEVPSAFDTDKSTDQVITIHLKHPTITVTPDNPQTPGGRIDGSEGIWPSEAGKEELTKTITRNIHYVDGLTRDEVADSVTQKVIFNRHVIIDKVTGAVLGYDTNRDDQVDITDSDDAWMTDSNTWAEVTSPDLSSKGYEAPDVSKVDEKVVTSNISDETVTVTYNRSMQKVVYTIIDDSADTTLEDKVAFDSGASETNLHKTQKDFDAIIKTYTDKGYEVVNQGTLPTAFDTDSSKDQEVVVHLKHAIITVTPEDPKKPGQPIDGSESNWPSEAGANALSKTITRTIDYLDELTSDKIADSVNQSMTFKRHVIIDKVTGEVLGYDTNGDDMVDTTDADDAWMTDSNTWAEVTSPDLSLKGYEAPDVSKVDEKVVTSNISDETVTVTYNRSMQKVVYTIIDDTAKKTLEDNVLLDTGPSGASLNKTQEDLQKIADGYGTKGYAIVSVDTLPEHFDIDPSTDQVVIIHLEHTYETITPDNAKTPGDPIDGSESVWPKEAGKENLQKSTTRTIEYIDGMTKENVADSVEQTVEFERHVILDKVTGEVLGYDTNDDNQVDTEDPDQAWMHTDGEWSEVVSPDLSSQGYEKPSMEKVEAENVDPSTETKTIQIVYEISNRIILPSTGGIGSLFYTISGLILTGIGWKGFRKNKKK